MATLAEYKVAVTAHGYDAVTSATAILNAINAARRDIIGRRRWSWLEAAQTLTATPGTATVSLAAITDLLHVDAVRLTLAGLGYPISHKPPQEFKDIAATDLTTRAEPRFWTEYDGVLRLWPLPDQAYSVGVDYVAKPADLAIDADTCPIPGNDQDAVGWGAAKHLAYRQRDPNLMQLAEAQFEAALARMVRNDKRRQRQTPSRVRASGLYC